MKYKRDFDSATLQIGDYISSVKFAVEFEELNIPDVYLKKQMYYYIKRKILGLTSYGYKMFSLQYLKKEPTLQ